MDMLGQTVSHYRILSKLGVGGMGVVYEAEDLRLGRHVALKFIPDHLASDKRSLDRFTREARAASLLNHPNICTIHDIETDSGHPFIVMEKLDGESLKQRIRGKAMDLEHVLDVAVQIADALAASHAKGIVHRDIKPANIFLMPGGQVKILDFGLAKLAKGSEIGTSTDSSLEESLTQVGVIPGTAVYMSPEQARSEDLDARSDIFSFGVVLYEMATGKKPFTGTNVVTTLHAVINRQPASPVTINPAIPRELETIIGKAMEKDRAQRYQNATEMKADLQRLKKETESGLTRSRLRSAIPTRSRTKTFRKTSSRRPWVLVGLAGILVTVLVALGSWWLTRRSVRVEIDARTIAVLPLQNINNNQEDEFLRFALADEIANALTYARTLEIRPSASTRKYVTGENDPQKIGRELGVGLVIAGHFLRQSKHVMVTLEAVSVKDNKLVWTGTLVAPAENLIALQTQLAKKVRQELLPVLGVATGAMDASSSPANGEAYDLYLRSVSIPHDPDPNKQAITMLEHAVALDPKYAPAWEALGRRYYFDAIYSGGGAAAYQRSDAAYERALSLEPGRVSAAGFLAQNHVEAGQLDKAYAETRDLVTKRPSNAMAHFSLSYVLRYAGLLDQAQRECNEALTIDSGNFNFRSCAFAFFETGKTGRAKVFLNLDTGSEWSNAVMVTVLMRDGDTQGAQRAAQQMTDNPTWMRDFLKSCLNKAPSSDLQSQTERVRKDLLPEQDSELKYYQGAVLASCGQKQAAFAFLRKAVDEKYCAHQALQSDPLLAGVRQDPEFQSIVEDAQLCQQKLLSGPTSH